MLPSLWTMLNQAIQKREGVGKNKKMMEGVVRIINEHYHMLWEPLEVLFRTRKR